MDATRSSDGRVVSIKRVKKSDHPIEEQIIRFFSEAPDSLDPRNHSVPVYDVLPSPMDQDVVLLVMPYLVPVGRYKFATVGEAVELFRQLFEVSGRVRLACHWLITHVEFRRVYSLCIVISSRTGTLCSLQESIQYSLSVSSDLQYANVMMEPIPLLSDVPHPTHPHRSYDFQRKVKQSTRTKRPTKYYIIDFGLSRQFSPGEELIASLNIGGDRSVPEYQDPSRMHNPFPIDVYHLGNMIKTRYTKVGDMTQEITQVILNISCRRASV